MEINCIACGKEFKPKNYWQKYCSKNCKQAGWAVKKIDSVGYLKKFEFEYNNNKDELKKLTDGYMPNKEDIYKIQITFFRPPVDRLSHNTKKEIKKGSLIYCDTTPDIDNAVKPIIDSMTGIFWNDDRQIVELVTSKFFSADSKIIVVIKVY